SAATSSGETAMPTTGAYAPSSTGRTLPDAALADALTLLERYGPAAGTLHGAYSERLLRPYGE
ncbi:hypothetical protein, partial [Kitasatospora sp. NPDC056531]|uniref:hypothetical protein n=1 Tax=Kitasatospora sp. NPDC056531 TaxID=3345856 RepID=UPI003677934B